MCRRRRRACSLIGTYAAEVLLPALVRAARSRPAGVSVRPCAMEYVGLSIAGPNARALLQSLVRDDLSNGAFPFMSFRPHGRRHGARLWSGASPSPAISATRSG